MEQHTYVYNKGDVTYSIVIPVYNQENIILRNLKSIIKNTLDNYEIIIILDFCFDNTESKLLTFLESTHFSKKNLIQITVLVNHEKPLFETKCDNIGFKRSIGKYCLEIQSDMEMTQYGYNRELVKPFLKYENVIGVSGRCAHTIFGGYKCVGRINIEQSVDEIGIERCRFYVLETCNRGPLMLDKKKLEEMNYLNEEDYFLDNSDHDLFIRSNIEKGYICGYVPIDFNAPLCDGSCRNQNTYDNCENYLINKAEKERLTAISENKPTIQQKYGSKWVPKRHIIYDL